MNASNSMSHHEIGIDVSKASLDVFDGGAHWQVSNTKAGIRKLLARLAKVGSPASSRLTCESTGRYGHLLAAMALEAGWPLAIANPRAVRDYARATGRLAKTDRIDAAVIAGFARMADPPVLDASWNGRQRFVELHSRLRALIAQAAAQKACRDHYREPEILAEIRGTIALLERRIEACECKLQAMVEDSPAMKPRWQTMLSIKGVGKRTALALLASMPELGTLNRGEAAALAGLAPMNRDSGSLRGKRSIQAGRSPARTALYLAALAAARSHPTLSVFYQRLKSAGKSPKVALCAVARKLLILINTTLKPTAVQT